MTYTRRVLAIKTAKLRSKSEFPTSAVGECLRETRECYVIGPDARDAYEAWQQSPSKHLVSALDVKTIPRGVPVFWKGGSEDHGHVAISTGYGGNCWSMDIRRKGYFDKVPINEIHAVWGLRLLGWTEDLNGIKVYP